MAFFIGNRGRARRDQLRKQRDAELSSYRPFPLITLAEWQSRTRKARFPVAATFLAWPILFTILIIAVDFCVPGDWSGVLTFAYVVGAAWGLVLLPMMVLRRYGVSCPYCPNSFTLDHNGMTYERNRPYDDRVRCSGCQRVIFTDWSQERDLAKTQHTTRRAFRWYLTRAAVASALLMSALVFVFWGPYIPDPQSLVLHGLGRRVIYLIPAAVIASVSVSMCICIFIPKDLRHLFRALLKVAAVLLVGGVTVWAVVTFNCDRARGLRSFGERMQREADISSIRAWAEGYHPLDGDIALLEGEAFNVMQEHWPESIKRLGPSRVNLFLKEKRAMVLFRGKYTFWIFTVAQAGTTPTRGRTLVLADGVWAQ